MGGSLKRSRITIGIFLVSTLAAWAMTPLLANSKAAVPGVGTTSSSLQLLEVTLTDVPQLGTLQASLGIAGTEATTVASSLASVLYSGVTVAGQTTGAQSVTSRDGASSTDASIPLSGPGIDGSLTIANLSADSTPDSATALLSALSGQVDIATLGLSATTGENGIKSQVLKELAASHTGASLGPITLTVGDLLPPEVLGALPLSALIDLADGLNIDLGATLTTQIQALRDLLGTLDTLQAKLAELAAAQGELSDLVGGNDALLAQIEAASNDVAAAQAAVAAAGDAIDAAQDAIADAQAALTAAQGAVPALQADLSAAQDLVDDLNADKAVLEAEKATVAALLAACPAACGPLQAQLDTLNAQIATLNSQIGAATTARDAAAATLAAAQSAVTAAQAQLADAQADLTDAQAQLAAAQAQLATARAALDALLAGLDAEAIKALQGLIDTLQAAIAGLLDTVEGLIGQLPDLSAVLDQLVNLLADSPLVKVNELSVSVLTAANSAGGNAQVTCGASGVSILGQPLGALTCGELSGKFDEIAGAVMDLLSSLPVVGGAVPAITVEGLKAATSASDGPDADGVTQARASLTALHLAIPSVELGALVDTLVADAIAEIEAVVGALPAGSDAVQGLLDTLRAQLEALPTGQALDGLKTIGVDAVLGGLTSESSFRAAPAQGPTNRPPTQPEVPEVPDGPEQAPPSAPLPFTGTSVPTALPIALALWLVMAGSLLMFFTEHGPNLKKVLPNREHTDG
ncbi:MAG: hypothetical protein M3345_02740 [Actinomycetota bacterium]|nr:hypothetical protein [Actinomycetota bacterium]